MRVVSCNSFAPVDQLVVEERPSLPLPDGHVRIAVTACGVNFVDALIVQGLYQLKPTLPFVPGGEVAGTIAVLGPTRMDYSETVSAVAMVSQRLSRMLTEG